MFKFTLIFLFFSWFFVLENIHAEGDSLKVYFFLSETCPICKAITRDINEITQKTKGQKISFVGIFPNLKISNEKTRLDFVKKYNIDFPVMPDSGHLLTRKFQAAITPEVILMHSPSGNILYRGAINNAFLSIGKRRTIITDHYLKTAIDQYFNLQEIIPSKTTPVGCLIEQRNY